MSANEFPRKFVAKDEVLDDWSRIEPYYDQLRDRALTSPADVEAWLIDWSELSSVIDEVRTDRYIQMGSHTDDVARKEAYLEFVQEIDPKCKPREHELRIKYTQTPAAADLPRDRYAVLDRSLRAQVELFREENIPLEVEEETLSQQFQEICGAQSVEFEGNELTLQQLAPYYEQTDRELRQRAWEAETNRRLADADALEGVFERMLDLRHQIALNAGCSDYRAYSFLRYERFDYTPEDCEAFHTAIEQTMVPLLRQIHEQRRAALGVERLRPWDQSVDVHGQAPLKPFSSVEEFCQKTSRALHRLDPELGLQFDYMNDRGYLDLESRKGKAPGGYQANYEEARHPFIFMNAVGLHSDVMTLVHEAGHSFHQMAARHDPLLPYRSSPIEFAEVASFGMELLSADYFDEFYNEEELARARRIQIERVIWLFPWVCTIDAFQHWVYLNPQHSREERRSYWLGLLDRFGGLTDWTGYEEYKGRAWQKQLHLFQVPFYYIEYAIAKLGALQIWQNARQDQARALRQYREGLALGGTRPLPELFQAAGARLDMSAATLEPLANYLGKELHALPL
jgi:oligoendopeptidase F